MPQEWTRIGVAETTWRSDEGEFEEGEEEGRLLDFSNEEKETHGREKEEDIAGIAFLKEGAIVLGTIRARFNMTLSENELVSLIWRKVYQYIIFITGMVVTV